MEYGSIILIAWYLSPLKFGLLSHIYVFDYFEYRYFYSIQASLFIIGLEGLSGIKIRSLIFVFIVVSLLSVVYLIYQSYFAYMGCC